MKRTLNLAVFLWLFCGVIGAWMLHELDSDHLKQIAYGPITLVQALNEGALPFSTR